MIAIAFLLQSAPIPPVAVPPRKHWSDNQACEGLKKIAADVMGELPMMVDHTTRLDGVSVICSLRTVTWNKFVTVSASQFRDGWQARKQAQFSDVICKNEAFLPLARRGWRFTQNLTFQSGERFVMDARC